MCSSEWICTLVKSNLCCWKCWLCVNRSVIFSCKCSTKAFGGRKGKAGRAVVKIPLNALPVPQRIKLLHYLQSSELIWRLYRCRYVHPRSSVQSVCAVIFIPVEDWWQLGEVHFLGVRVFVAAKTVELQVWLRCHLVLNVSPLTASMKQHSCLHFPFPFRYHRATSGRRRLAVKKSPFSAFPFSSLPSPSLAPTYALLFSTWLPFLFLSSSSLPKQWHRLGQEHDNDNEK